jgi:hypothetical protein
MLKGGYSLPLQRINGADVNGNPGEGPMFPLTRAAYVRCVYGKECRGI